MTFGGGTWSGFVEGSLFATYATETGPAQPRDEAFSTNWVVAGAQRTMGSRGLLLVRARASAEPATVKESGYPQLLQVVSPEHGGPRLDAMRGQKLIGEAAVAAAIRMGQRAYVHLYAAPVGDPALGPLPHMVRASSAEFAEAPFAWDVQEAFHEATRVFTAGVSTQFVSVEGSVFHRGAGGSRTMVDDGPIDSWSARTTLSPTRNVSVQLSRGQLGDDGLEVTSGSLSAGSRSVAASVIYTTRDTSTAVTPAEPRGTSRALAVELTFRTARNTFMVRGESVENPAAPSAPLAAKREHVTVGWIFDVLVPQGWRLGAGVNADYHTKYRELETRYGHKPQTVYAFVRLRTDGR